MKNLYLEVKDHALSGERFELHYNKEHDLLKTVPVPDNLDRYYDSTNYISHSDSKATLTDKLYQLVKRFSLKKKERLLKKHSPSKGRVLDYGAGTGAFVEHLQKEGWQAVGLEPNTKARTLANAKKITVYTGLEELHGQNFNVITLWHVLEHLPDLDIALNSLSGMLGENGKMIIAVPNYNSYDAHYYKEYWAAFDVPRHLWHFSRGSLTRIFENKGYALQEIKPMVFDAFYVSLLSEKYKTGRSRFLPAFFVGLWSNLKAWNNKEYSSLIYVFKKTEE